MQLQDKRNRLLTVLWYLTDIADNNGGHTIFALANGNRMGPGFSYKNCDVKNALKVQPRKGEVILFYSLTADKNLDKTSLHGACPVVGSDPKWAANKWIWSQPPSSRRRVWDTFHTDDFLNERGEFLGGVPDGPMSNLHTET